MTISGTDYLSWDAVEMAALVRRGEVSAGELAATSLQLMDRHRALNAVADTADPANSTDPTEAWTDGSAAPSAQPIGHGLLGGVPFAVKELLAWPGLPWTMGCRLMARNPAPGHSPYTQRLRAAGLNVLCSTTSSEFGLLGSTESALRGVTRNPWGSGLSAGGSSGGSAVLVAAGILPVAHGNDAGGSLRVPAALNGLFGFKPTNNRCAPAGTEAEGFTALVVEHCMSRTVRDSAHLLAATERHGDGALHPPVGLVTGSSATRRSVAVLTATLKGHLPDPAVARAVEDAAQLCESLGHEVTVVEAPDLDGGAISRLFFGGAARLMDEVAQTFASLLGRAPGPDELEPFTLELIEWGRTLPPVTVAESRTALRAQAQPYLRLVEHHDVVLSPTLARVSWPTGYLAPDAGLHTLMQRTEDAVGYTPIHNIAGCPAMSVPLAQHEGLPIGIHVAARPGADRLLLELAFELEEASPWAARRPDLAWLQGVS